MKPSGRHGPKWTARAVASLGIFLLATAAQADDAQTSGPKAANASKSQQAGITQSSSAAPGMKPLTIICVNSVQCFSAKRNTAAPNAPALDLRAPDVRKVFSDAELQQVLQDPDEQVYMQETVQVEGERPIAPASIGIMAIPWAIMHPTQAWRILMPVPSAK